MITRHPFKVFIIINIMLDTFNNNDDNDYDDIQHVFNHFTREKLHLHDTSQTWHENQS